MSHYVVNKFKDKNFRNHLGVVVFTALTLGSFAGPSNTVSPEYGEATSQVLSGNLHMYVNVGGNTKVAPDNSVDIDQLY